MEGGGGTYFRRLKQHEKGGTQMHKYRKYVSTFLLFLMLFVSVPVFADAAPLNLSPRDGVTQIMENAAGNFWEFVKGILWIAVAVTVIIAAFYFLGAGGDSRRIEKGRNMIILAVAFAAIALYAPDIVGLLRHILGG